MSPAMRASARCAASACPSLLVMLVRCFCVPLRKACLCKHGRLCCRCCCCALSCVFACLRASASHCDGLPLLMCGVARCIQPLRWSLRGRSCVEFSSYRCCHAAFRSTAMPVSCAFFVGLLAAVRCDSAVGADPFFPAGSDALLQALVRWRIWPYSCDQSPCMRVRLSPRK